MTRHEAEIGAAFIEKEDLGVGKHEDPKSPKDEPFKADPSKASPDGCKESSGKHADGEGKDGKK